MMFFRRGPIVFIRFFGCSMNQKDLKMSLWESPFLPIKLKGQSALYLVKLALHFNAHLRVLLKCSLWLIDSLAICCYWSMGHTLSHKNVKLMKFDIRQHVSLSCSRRPQPWLSRHHRDVKPDVASAIWCWAMCLTNHSEPVLLSLKRRLQYSLPASVIVS